MVRTRLQAKREQIRVVDPLGRDTFALFAFNATSDSDVIRMTKLAEMFDVRVTSASEQEAPSGQTEESNPYHFQCDFKASLLGGVDADAVVLMLDYFWLQNDWWKLRYGENWLASRDCKVVEVFQRVPKLKVCMIPLDSSSSFMVKCAEDAEVRTFLKTSQLEMELIDWKDAQKHHPLCISTAVVYKSELSHSEKRAYIGQGRYVGVAVGNSGVALDDQENDSATPKSFVVVYRANVQWREVVASFLSVSPKNKRRRRKDSF